MLRLVLLAFGLITLVGLIWHVGLARILDAAAGLGPSALLVILLPSTLMYVLETLGWRFTLGRYAGTVSFGRLVAIRAAGEVINMTTPTAYVGGEPLKAYLLKRSGVPLVDGLASVITAKTTMTIAQVAFILLGIGVSVWTVGPHAGELGFKGSLHVQLAAAVISGGLLLLGVFLFFVVQRRGLFMGLLRLLRRGGIYLRVLESRQEKLLALDQTINEFYRRARGAFLLSTGACFFGWLAEGLEVYAILFYLAPPIDLSTAISIAAFAVVIKGGAFFIPGSVGAQEGGNLLLLMAYGYSDLTGITFAILRRLRELVWIGIGLVCMVLLEGFGCRKEATDHKR